MWRHLRMCVGVWVGVCMCVRVASFAQHVTKFEEGYPQHVQWRAVCMVVQKSESPLPQGVRTPFKA